MLSGLPPVVMPATRLLLLGSFPGVASLNAGQYYAHPRNQFWTIVGRLFELDLKAMAYAERLQAVARRGLGIWDAYARCERKGSLDSAIVGAEWNDLAGLVATLPALRGIAHNGSEAARARRLTADLGVPVFRLPSTSPAHASWTIDRKLLAWREVFVACELLD